MAVGYGTEALVDPVAYALCDAARQAGIKLRDVLRVDDGRYWSYACGDEACCPAAGTPFARQSNLDIKTGEFIPVDDRRMIYQLANMLWHSDSSFKPVPALCSLLSARIIPPEGGATEFASTRCAYPALPEDMKRRVAGAIAVHDFSWSRDQIRPGFFTAEERATYPPVRHPLVRTNPVNGRQALFLGAHASHIEGMPIEEGRALLKALLDHVTQPQFRYRHEWTEGDLVVWDNRCVLHRATPYDSTRYKRLLQRTTVSGDPGEFSAVGRGDRPGRR